VHEYFSTTLRRRLDRFQIPSDGRGSRACYFSLPADVPGRDLSLRRGRLPLFFPSSSRGEIFHVSLASLRGGEVSPVFLVSLRGGEASPFFPLFFEGESISCLPLFLAEREGFSFFPPP